jgi:hypothetical protein
VGAAPAAGRLAGSRLQRVQWWQQGLRALCANAHQILCSVLLTHLLLAMHCVHLFEGLGIDQHGCCQCQTMHCLRRCSALCHCPLTPLSRGGQVLGRRSLVGLRTSMCHCACSMEMSNGCSAVSASPHQYACGSRTWQRGKPSSSVAHGLPIDFRHAIKY